MVLPSAHAPYRVRFGKWVRRCCNDISLSTGMASSSMPGFQRLLRNDNGMLVVHIVIVHGAAYQNSHKTLDICRTSGTFCLLDEISD